MTQFSFDYDSLTEFDQLEKDEQELFKLAEAELEKAYAPYSNFYVGAAILLDNGQNVVGSNQENASYSLCMCAERVALYAMTSQYPGAKALKMAVVANNPQKAIEKAIPPCGACRQVILEFETRFEEPIMILLKDDLGNYYRFANARQLLPLAFDKNFLATR
jgi:cytidine deaminase